MRAGKGLTLFILNEDMNDVIKIIKPLLEDSNVLTDGIRNKKQEGGFLPAFLGPLAASLVQLVLSSVVKGISGRGVRRAGKGYMNKNF